MPIESVSSRNVNQSSQNSQSMQSSQDSRTSQNFQNMNFEDYSAWVFPEVPERASTKLKLGVFCTTLAGVTAALAGVMKFRKIPFNMGELFKGNYKKCGLWNVQYKGGEILTVGAGSILGGLLGGALFDKKDNQKAKLREAVIQYFGNICAPLACITSGLWIYQKYKEPIMKHNFTTDQIKWLKLNNKYKAELDKLLKKGPKFAITTTGLVAGIILGNKIGNILNEQIFHIKDNRKLKPADMSPHVDDVCYAISLADENNPITHVISRIVPAALMISGYSTGVIKERPDRIRHEHNCQDCKNT